MNALKYFFAMALLLPGESRSGSLSELDSCHQSLGEYPAQMRRVTTLTSKPLSFIAEKDKQGRFTGLTVFNDKSIRFYPAREGTTRFLDGKPAYREYYMDVLLPSQLNEGIGRTVKLVVTDKIKEAAFPWNALTKEPKISFNGESGFNPFSTSRFSEGRDDVNPEARERIRALLMKAMGDWEHLLNRRTMLENSPLKDSDMIKWQDKERKKFILALEGCLSSSDREIASFAREIKSRIEFSSIRLPRDTGLETAAQRGTH